MTTVQELTVLDAACCGTAAGAGLDLAEAERRAYNLEPRAFVLRILAELRDAAEASPRTGR